MRVRLASVAVVGLVVLTACSSTPEKSEDPGRKDDKSTLPTVSAGTVLPDALTEAHCVRTAKGFWSADGEVKNTTAEKRDLEVRIHVGPATGEKARAHVKLVTDLKPGKSAEWSVLKVTADDPKGPCQIQVAVAQ